MFEEWLGKHVNKEDLTRHDKWLCMMLPRLKLLRELLSDDGAIFVSIDDNEAHRLRMLMDEVFGEENFRNCIVAPRGTKNVQSQFEEIDSLSSGHDSLLVYTKSSATRLKKLQSSLQKVEPGKWDTFWRGTDRPTMRYDLFGQIPDQGQWRWSEERGRQAVVNYEKYLEDYADNITLDEYYTQELQLKGVELNFVRLSDDGSVQYYVSPRSYKITSDVWMDVSSRGTITSFPTEKPVDLIRRVLIWCTDSNSGDIIFDSFAGSGTTAHAVLAQNAEDGGNRRFVLVEQEDYADTLTAERVRRVMAGVPAAKDAALREGYGGSFSFFRLGDRLEEDALLRGELPSYAEMARYVFFTATGEQIDESQIDETAQYLGQSRSYEVYLIYQPDLAFLKQTPLTLNWLSQVQRRSSKTMLVIAPYKLVDNDILRDVRAEFCQLPFGIFRNRV